MVHQPRVRFGLDDQPPELGSRENEEKHLHPVFHLHHTWSAHLSSETEGVFVFWRQGPTFGGNPETEPPAHFCNSQLPFLRELTACLAVYHARVSTWAESEVEDEGLKLNAKLS